MPRQLHFVLFANVANMLRSSSCPRQLLSTVEKEPETLKHWFDFNKLSLSLNKNEIYDILVS